jgi:tetratricopeptide (TPR) repeat protein
MRGLIFEAMKQLDAARADLEKVYASNPERLTALEALRRLEASPIDRAIKKLTEEIEGQPKDFFLYRERGVAYVQNGELDRALADFSKAIEAGDHRCYLDRGLVRFRLRDYRQAVGDLDAAVEYAKGEWAAEPSYAFGKRAAAYYELGDYDHAIADYTAAIGNGGANDPVLYNGRGLS